MSARDVVLGRLRDALGGSPAPAPGIPRAYRTAGGVDGAPTARRFAERVADYRATVHSAASRDLSATLARIVHEAGARRVGVPGGLPGSWTAGLEAEVVRDDPDDPGSLDVDLVITAAAVGIAETGTVVLDASADQGRRALTLVPDHHVCVVAADRIVATVPDALERLEPTRPLTFVSGPSATSDIELDRVEGVHGPRVLDVVVLDA